eukprot:TRINITY_DN15500_c0_g1::TRINITY_DN15500_c0_g1_i1::g.30575::m.30575 TRINITY_DN15500_c0_g1::TRINITY_DN15500_c0_g1_i1::g.30575  ORF type:complete len:210 (+),score=-1.60,sp/Q8T3C8/MTFP1_CAEEL/46.84/1e-34,MTP18/PF10558.4/1.2e-34 TRINITY_DN15500_c0_g1_i1:84-632(+)
MESLEMKKSKEFDVLRDSPLRYLGYANEVGESFRPLVPKFLVNFSYLVAFGYVGADAYIKTRKAYNEHKTGKVSVDVARLNAAEQFVDVTLWQTLASVVIPGYLINRTVWLTQKVLHSRVLRGHVGAMGMMQIPTLVGLGAIPFIVHPIDEAVEASMHHYVRPYIRPALHAIHRSLPTAPSK